MTTPERPSLGRDGIRDETPFRSELENFEGGEKLYQLRNNPDFVIRELVGREFDQTKGILLRQQQQQMIELWHEYFDEHENYGINIPQARLVKAKNREGHHALFLVTDKIEGTHVADAPDESAEEFDKFCEGVAKYYLDKRRKGESHWGEVRLDEQVMHGKTKRDDAPKVYLADLDVAGADARVYGYEAQSNKAIVSLRNFIERLERKFGVKLERAREKYSELIGALQLEDDLYTLE